MKTHACTILVSCASLVFWLLPVRAQITISDFLLTSNSVTFNINGTFTSPTPPLVPNGFSLVNPTLFADPGFALGNFTDSTTSSFSGSQALWSMWNPVRTGSPQFGDYFFVAFENNFAISEAINGTVSANWSSPVFDPSAVLYLNVYWGSGNNINDPSSGTLLTSVVVPEPSSYALLILAGLFALWRAKRRRPEQIKSAQT